MTLSRSYLSTVHDFEKAEEDGEPDQSLDEKKEKARESQSFQPGDQFIPATGH
ncbi:MAG: hypothetical protein KFF73_05645 [Cyclobacteriaceae bacterium]|nr:hypothetical protein [Cyclobacteriaceae bacterium]